MQKHVAIGVPTQTLGMSQRDSTDLERNTRFEFVRVPTAADPHTETPAKDLPASTRIVFVPVVECLNLSLDISIHVHADLQRKTYLRK
jgi:hypothetical protein